MRISHKTGSILISILLFSGCDDGDTVTIKGEISKTSFIQVQGLSKKSRVIITSHGGDGDYALDIAEIILSKDLSVQVVDYCLSACADIIVPAGKRIVMTGKPLIGFHGNPFTDNLVLKRLGEHEGAACEIKRMARMKRILQARGLSEEAWVEQIKRIRFEKVVKNPSAGNKNSCHFYRFYMKDKFWFPTSQQLSVLFGWKFEGEVCADDPECIRNKTRKYWKPGSSFIVGDIYYKT